MNCPCSSMDRTRASEACDVGSIPAGGTINAKSERGNDNKFLSSKLSFISLR